MSRKEIREAVRELHAERNAATHAVGSFPILGNHTLIAVSTCGRFGLYRADKFGKRGPAALYEYAVADSETGKTRELRSRVLVDCWIAKASTGAECFPFYQSSSIKPARTKWLNTN